MEFSPFGQRLAVHTGVSDLMEDMAAALAGGDVRAMLGGGNPARIPAVEEIWRRRVEELVATGDLLERTLGNYDSPIGSPSFRRELAHLLALEYGWEVTEDHIAITNGSQQAFFVLLNLFRGRILLPITPEYIGYADQPLSEGKFVACRPSIERVDSHTHKYRVNFEAVERLLTESHRESDPSRRIGAICASRPTNPSGNVLTDEEVRRLDTLARAHGIPLIIDNAYGLPFPSIVFADRVEGTAQPMWNENTILAMSLSKLGLPGTRTGIIVAGAEIVRAIAHANAVTGLATTTVGQAIVQPLLTDRSILAIAGDHIAPFYRQRSDFMLSALASSLSQVPDWSVHRIEGSIFAWLWLPALESSSLELYNRLKRRGVVVVPGEYFFFGETYGADEQQWPHSRQCLRLNYGREPHEIEAGLAILAQELIEAPT